MRTITTLLILILVTQTISCASNTIIPNGYAKLYYDHNTYDTNGQPVLITELIIDGEEKTCAAPPCTDVISGHHKVVIKARWSNSSEDETVLDVDIVAEKQYVIFAFELAPNQNPANAIIRPKTYGEELKEAAIQGLLEGAFKGLFPVIVITAPIWITGIMFLKPRPTSKNRPFDGCCFIWIEDMKSGEVIAGKKP